MTRRASSPTGWALQPSWSVATVGSSLIPAGYRSVLAPHETRVAVLGDHHDEGVGQSASEAVGGAVAGPNPSGALLGGPLPLQVEGLAHGGNRWQLAGDLTAEAQQLEALGHEHCAVHGSEAGHEVGELEDRLVELSE